MYTVFDIKFGVHALAWLFFISTNSKVVAQMGNPCPGIINFVADGTVAYISLVLPLQRVNEVTVEYTYISRNKQNGYFDLAINANTAGDYIRSGKAVTYKLRLPPTDYLQPKITKIYSNDKLVCSGPPVGLYSGRTKRTSSHSSKITLGTLKPLDNYSETPISKYQITKKPTTEIVPYLYDNRNICGVSLSSRSIKLIMGGQAMRRGKYPWMAALYVRTNDNWNYQCGGTLISSYHVISAAHCMNYPGSKRRLEMKDTQILLGGFDLALYPAEQGSYLSQVRNIFIHADYNADAERASADADIAIVSLEDEVKFTNTIQPICLWPDEDGLSGVEGTEGIVAGWGVTETGNLPNTPREIATRIVGASTCMWSDVRYYYLTSPRTFCAGGLQSGSGPCRGDSGSALMVNIDSKMYLIGVVSTALGHENHQCDLTKYVVYTNALQFKVWILDQLNKRRRT